MLKRHALAVAALGLGVVSTPAQARLMTEFGEYGYKHLREFGMPRQ